MATEKMRLTAAILFIALISVALCDTIDSGKTGDCSTNECLRRRLQLRLPRMDGVKVGHTQEVELQEGKKHVMKTLSLNPPVFEIPNFFIDDECEYVIDMAKGFGMYESKSAIDKTDIGGETTKKTFEAWDTNNDGYVDAEEIIYIPGKSDLYITVEEIKEMFDKLSIDMDGDGKMSYTEFYQVTAHSIRKYFVQMREERTSLRSRTSSQAWLFHDDNHLLMYEDVLEDFHQRLSKLTNLPKKLIEETEPVQVVHYKENGHYHCHHDSEVVNKQLPCCTYTGMEECRICRYISIMVYLNDVEEGGISAFPIADNKTFNWDAWAKSSNEQCNLARHCHKSNLLVTPEKGKAILWYNHKVDGSTGWMGVQDPMALHGECPVVKGEKWVANMYMDIIGDGSDTLKGWAMSTNWLKTSKRDQDIINSFEHGLIELNEPKENRYTEDKNTKGISLKGHLDDALSEMFEDKIIDEEVKDSEGEAKVEEVEEDVEVKETKSEPQPPSPPIYNAAPLPLPKEVLEPKGPKEEPSFRPLPPPNVEGNRIVQSILLLLEELDNTELEIVARVLHDKLKLVCVPLIMNPMA